MAFFTEVRAKEVVATEPLNIWPKTWTDVPLLLTRHCTKY